MNGAEGYLTVASILSGFGVTVLMFRIQRELQVRAKDPESQTWLAWADYLVLGAIILSLIFVVLPIVATGHPGNSVLNLAAASCGASAVLLAGYPFAILDHYRIEIGTKREGERAKGEPVERWIVIVSSILAAGVFASIILLGW